MVPPTESTNVHKFLICPNVDDNTFPASSCHLDDAAFVRVSKKVWGWGVTTTWPKQRINWHFSDCQTSVKHGCGVGEWSIGDMEGIFVGLWVFVIVGLPTLVGCLLDGLNRSKITESCSNRAKITLQWEDVLAVGMAKNLEFLLLSNPTWTWNFSLSVHFATIDGHWTANFCVATNKPCSRMWVTIC